MSLVVFICGEGDSSAKEAILVFGDKRPTEIPSPGGIIVRSGELEVDEAKFRSIGRQGIKRIAWFGVTTVADGEGV